jgi:hypothetical protein
MPRTGWPGRRRRIPRDYEALHEVDEAMDCLRREPLMLHRLASPRLADPLAPPRTVISRVARRVPCLRQ